MMKKRTTPFSSDLVHIPIGESVYLEGELFIPPEAKGIVLFAHGSGSSRFSARNRYVAEILQKSGSGTLLFDLLTKEEEQQDKETGELRFNIPFLAKRLLLATDWLLSQHPSKIGYFGASTGSAATLIAAAALGKIISAIVSRGGRPDLALEALSQVQAATLFIVGSNDDVVLQLNQKALEHLFCEKKFAIIPNATHLFEEPGTLEEVARHAAAWFQEHWINETATTLFQDRREAGILLAKELSKFSDHQNTLVLGLPRGGIPVAYQVAKHLHLPLDVFIVRKLGLPNYPELAMGAIATGGIRILNQAVLKKFSISSALLDAITAQETKELERREFLYRANHQTPEIRDKIILLVDDGIATGASMQAAVQALRLQHPKRIIVAIPIAAPSSCTELAQQADEVITLMKPPHFQAVGQFYNNFSQTTDEEVIELLKKNRTS